MSRLAIAGCVALLLAACTTAPSPSAGGDPDALTQVDRWILQGASDAKGERIDVVFPGGTALHAMSFDAGRVSLAGGCNRIFGSYGIDGEGRLVVDALASTRMACADASLMAADTAVSDLVQGTAELRIAESWPEQLFLVHSDGRRSAWTADRPRDTAGP